jgi:hAT family C-terminal dimerisation region
MFKPEYDSKGRRKKNQKPDNTVKDYWLSKAKDYPILLQMARDYLSIPATSAPSERAFSDSGNTLTKKRCKLSPQSIRIVVCLRS